MKCICKQCGKEFELTQSEIDFYNGKNLSIPKRCEECRAQNKKQKKAKAAGAKRAAGNGKNTGTNQNSGAKTNNTMKPVTTAKAEKTADTNGKATAAPSGTGKKKSGKFVQVLKLIIALLIVGLVIYSAFRNNDDGSNVTDTYGTQQDYADESEDGLQDIPVLEESESVQSAETDSSQSVEPGESQEVADREDEGMSQEVSEESESETLVLDLHFRNNSLLESHYEKHGKDMGFASAKEYEAAAAKVVANSETLHKLEAEDGDDVYYLESTNEFVVVAKDGYIRTYFLPSAGIDYYNRQ